MPEMSMPEIMRIASTLLTAQSSGCPGLQWKPAVSEGHFA